jgi:hypothetical protein
MYSDGTDGVLIGGETPPRNQGPDPRQANGRRPPPQPRIRDDVGDQPPLHKPLMGAVEDTPVPILRKQQG